MENFTGFALPPALTQTLTRMEYKTPTPIQAQTIPLALEGRDILGSAQTGTGKTGAFSIPVIAKLMESPRGSALIMLPTRELAVQVVNVIKQMLGNGNSIKTACLIGGESMHPQFKQLQARPRIIVGTPGRINDHLERGSLKLHDAGILVLDETDRMLDMGFGIQIDRILKFVPKVRQTLMFSATMPKNIMAMAAKYLTNPERIEVGAVNKTAENIRQEIIYTAETEKYAQLTDQLNKRDGSIIIFVKTKRNADSLAVKLNRENYEAEAIHGDLPQRKRDRVIKGFRASEFRILVATDIAARGLDIDHIRHVINYHLPQAPEDFIHRIGRTARAGAEGDALCLVAPDERGKMNAIRKLIDPNFKPEKTAGGSRGGDSGGYARKSGNGGKRFGGGKRDGGFKKSFRNEGDAEFKPRGEKKFDKREGGFKSEGDFRGKRDGEFKPRGERSFGEKREGGFNKGFRNEGDSEFKPRGEKRFGGKREGGFKSEGDFRGKRDGEFKPRGERSFGEKREGGFKSEGGFRGKRDGEFKPRGERPFGENREGGFKSEGGFRGKRDGDFKPRGERSFGEKREGGFRGKRDGDFKPRGEKSFGGKREGGFKSEGGFRKEGGAKRFGKNTGGRKFGGPKRDAA